jgi:hypothetical protein
MLNRILIPSHSQIWGEGVGWSSGGDRRRWWSMVAVRVVARGGRSVTVEVRVRDLGGDSSPAM